MQILVDAAYKAVKLDGLVVSQERLGIGNCRSYTGFEARLIRLKLGAVTVGVHALFRIAHTGEHHHAGIISG